jgi:peptidyl-tRNA hydrolase, PTH1 family
MARLILGLGNPGERYRDTRHNVGFLVVEELARRWGLRLDRPECGAFVGGEDPLLAQPQTYMNRSGWAARCLVETHGLDPSGVLVVYDEVALPFGRLRLRKSGSPAGHRGLESVIENLRTDQVPRLRLGISPEDGPPRGEDLADFVLAPFPVEQREALVAMVHRAADACEVWLREGAEAAMQKFN